MFPLPFVFRVVVGADPYRLVWVIIMLVGETLRKLKLKKHPKTRVLFSLFIFLVFLDDKLFLNLFV